jgi:uncharacterized membrane protein (DUF485 family)
MENSQESIFSNDQSFFDLRIDEYNSSTLLETAKWAKFLAILGIVFLSILVLVALLIAFNPDMMRGSYLRELAMPVSIGIIVFSAIGGIYVYHILNFAVKITKGVNENDIFLIEKGISSLKIYMILLGVYSMLGILFTLVLIFISKQQSASYYN